MEQFLSKLPESQQLQPKPRVFRIDLDLERTTLTQESAIKIKTPTQRWKRHNTIRFDFSETQEVITANSFLNSDIIADEAVKATIKRFVVGVDSHIEIEVVTAKGVKESSLEAV